MFVKRSTQKITYSSGGNNTQVDYILVRRRRMKEVWDTKVITGESVAKQHRLVVSKMVMWTKVEEDNKTREKNKNSGSREKRRYKTSSGRRYWRAGSWRVEGGYEAITNGIRDTARELLGTASGKRGREDRETWWWNKDVQQAVKEKKVMKEMEEITEMKTALKKRKKGKARGPDDIPVEVWLILGDVGIGFLTKLMNRLLKGERMPDEWRKCVVTPIYKDKGDSKECGNYRGIKLMSHTIKLWKRVVEARLRQKVVIGDQQFGFMPRRSTTDAIFGLRMMMEKWREGQKELHCVFIDLEKAYDRVPREELWECMRQARVPECYVESIQDMYKGARTSVRSAVGLTEDFEVRVGLHQGSPLSPFLFSIIMDVLTKDVREEAPWDMMFANDVVLCRENKEELGVSLERWRKVFEERELKVSRKKTKYLQAGGAEQGTGVYTWGDSEEG